MNPINYHSVPNIVSTLELQGYSYLDRRGLLPGLTDAFSQCGGWVLERKTTSATTIEFSLEIQLRAIIELYGSLVAAGIELTRETHSVLTDLCTCRQHIARAVPRSSQAGQVLTIRLVLRFVEDVTLNSLLLTGSDLA